MNRVILKRKGVSDFRVAPPILGTLISDLYDAVDVQPEEGDSPATACGKYIEAGAVSVYIAKTIAKVLVGVVDKKKPLGNSQ